MRLLLINPRNPLVNITNKNNYWNKYRVWKPLGLLVLAGLTPPEWDITVVDENVDVPDYSRIPRPDLVGVTAFTSQAPRAYEVAAVFRDRGVPVVMGGIHATMRPDEGAKRVDVVVTGEAESIWKQVLQDAARGALRPMYAGDREKWRRRLRPDTISCQPDIRSGPFKPRVGVRSTAVSAVSARSTEGLTGAAQSRMS